MAVTPTEDRVLIKPLEAEETTSGGIVLPDTAKEKPQKGEVVATGPGNRLDDGSRRDLEVEVGDTVLFGKYAGTSIRIDGAEHSIMRETDVLAILEE